MKKLFQSHIPDGEQEMERVWRDALIIFDANTILNLYRYSDKSRSEFVSLLENLRQRIWMPEQAAYEYFKNRSVVIGEQGKAYDAAKKSINDLRDALRKDRGHPFIDEKTMSDLSSILEKVDAELTENQERQISRIPRDDIMTEIVSIFDGRVGDKLSNEDLEKIFDEGVKRYDHKIPPGYKDSSKHDNPKTLVEKRSVFGDLIVWKQIIAKAAELQKSVIFVTDDAKDDWWLEAQGKTIGPRIELLDEFHEYVSQKLYMYRPDQFLKHAKEQLHSEVSRETIDEIRAADESRVSANVENALMDRHRRRWKDKINRLAYYTDYIDSDLELDSAPVNALSKFYDSKYSDNHGLSVEARDAYLSEREAVLSNIESIRGELLYVTKQLSEPQLLQDLNMDEVISLRKRQKILENNLEGNREYLTKLKSELASGASLWGSHKRKDDG